MQHDCKFTYTLILNKNTKFSPIFFLKKKNVNLTFVSEIVCVVIYKIVACVMTQKISLCEYKFASPTKKNDFSGGDFNRKLIYTVRPNTIAKVKVESVKASCPSLCLLLTNCVQLYHSPLTSIHFNPPTT